jgi:hypothetical protein
VTPTGPIRTAPPWNAGGSFGIDWNAISRWDAFIAHAEEEFGVPRERLAATIVIESAGNERAIQRNHSNGWSYGLMQIVPFGVGWNGWHQRVWALSGSPPDGMTNAAIINALYDPLTNIRVGASILRDLYGQERLTRGEDAAWDAASSRFFLGNATWQGADTVNGNTGAQYRRALNGLMEEIGVGVPSSPLAYRVGLIPAGNVNRPRTAMNAGGPRFVTVHETGNSRNGANAEMHRVFVRDGGGAENVSFHLVVDDREAIQLLPFNEIGFHAGDGCDSRDADLGCFDSIAIETCVNADGNWERTKRNLVLLIAKLIRENPSLSADRIRQHNRWSGKDCPQRIRREGTWDALITQVKQELAMPGPGPDPVPEFVGLPAWCPPEYFTVMFPLADPNGSVTKKVIQTMNDEALSPWFEEMVDVAPGKRLWRFKDFTLLSEGSTVWGEGETP